MIRVALVAPMLDVRTAARRKLEIAEKISVVAEGGPGTLTDIVRYSRPDVLVISHAKESDALYALLRLHKAEKCGSARQNVSQKAVGKERKAEKPACLVLTENLTEHGVRRLLWQGAAGILRRSTAEQYLPWAVVTAAMGSLALDPGLTESVRNAYTQSSPADKGRNEAEARLSALSPREQEVLALVGDGLSNREIAGVLNLSPDTVKDHLRHIRAKLGVETRLHAARIAWQAGVGTLRS